MNNPYKQVNEFHEAFGHPQADKPTEIDENTALNRAIWTGEELVEFLYATAGGDKEKFSALLDEFHKGLDKAAVKILHKNPDVSNKLVAQMDALTDVSYFNYGSFAVAGVEPQPLFDIVHKANMGKLHNGVPKYRESDGKIQKPENWERDFAPESRLEAEIESQKL